MISGKLNQNFKVMERVMMNRTTDPTLDGHYGTIVGISALYPDVCAFYIILLDDPIPSGWKAITLIESCIDRLSNGDM